MNQYAKNINFAMRLHKDVPNGTAEVEAFGGGWEVILGHGALQSFYVSEVDNPPPEVRSDAVTVAGADGSIYMTEDTGRVLFEDKTVTVKFGGRGDDMNWNLVSVLRSGYQGRLVDFTFDDYRNVEHFQTGRVSVDFDPILCTFEMVFTEVPPFLFSITPFYSLMTARTNYELANNDSAWNFEPRVLATSIYRVNSGGTIACCMTNPNDNYWVKKPMGGQPGLKLLFGVINLVGGEVWFEDDDGNKSKTVATTRTTTLQDSSSEIRMYFKIDRSYYEWHTDGGGVRRYAPTIRCDFVLSNYVPTDSEGNIVNVDGDGIITHDFPSNVAIRPVCYNQADGYIIHDGVASKYTATGEQHTVPKFVLPRPNAKEDGVTTKSVFCAVPLDNGDADPVRMTFIPCEVF